MEEQKIILNENFILIRKIKDETNLKEEFEFNKKLKLISDIINDNNSNNISETIKNNKKEKDAKRI
jgi:hypothetical protein